MVRVSVTVIAPLGEIRSSFGEGLTVLAATRSALSAMGLTPGRTVKKATPYEAQKAELARLCREHANMTVTLTQVQERCTALLEEVRSLRGCLILPGWTCAHCHGFNGVGKEWYPACRACGAPCPGAEPALCVRCRVPVPREAPEGRCAGCAVG